MPDGLRDEDFEKEIVQQIRTNQNKSRKKEMKKQHE
jgi:hypothetical protein